MQPDYCVESKDYNSMNILRDSIKKLKDKNKQLILEERYPPIGLKLNLSLKNSIDTIQFKNCYFSEKEYKLDEIGIEIIHRDIGTGYHIPDGIFLWFG